MRFSRGLASGLIVIALLSAGFLAALPALAANGIPRTPVPTAGDGVGVTAKGTVKDSNQGGMGLTLSFDTEMLQLDLSGRSRVRFPEPAPGKPAHVDSFFDVFFDVTYRGTQETGTARVSSFFDIWVEITPPDPAAGIGGAAMVELQGTVPEQVFMLGSSGLGARVHSFFDIFTEISLDGSGGSQTTVDSFFDVFTEIAHPPDPGTVGKAVVQYQESDFERTVVMQKGDQGSSQTDSFFDITYRYDTPAGGSGASKVGAFFDIFCDFARKPGKGPQERKQGDMDLRARATSHSSSDWLAGDKFLEGDVHHPMVQKVKVKFPWLEADVMTHETGHWMGMAPEGMGHLEGDSFFDITYRIGLMTLRGSSEVTSPLMTDYGAPSPSDSSARIRAREFAGHVTLMK